MIFSIFPLVWMLLSFAPEAPWAAAGGGSRHTFGEAEPSAGGAVHRGFKGNSWNFTQE